MQGKSNFKSKLSLSINCFLFFKKKNSFYHPSDLLSYQKEDFSKFARIQIDFVRNKEENSIAMNEDAVVDGKQRNCSGLLVCVIISGLLSWLLVVGLIGKLRTQPKSMHTKKKQGEKKKSHPDV